MNLQRCESAQHILSVNLRKPGINIQSRRLIFRHCREFFRLCMQAVRACSSILHLCSLTLKSMDMIPGIHRETVYL